MSRSLQLVISTTFVKNLARVLRRLHLEVLFITLNEKGDLLLQVQSLQG